MARFLTKNEHGQITGSVDFEGPLEAIGVPEGHTIVSDPEEVAAYDAAEAAEEEEVNHRLTVLWPAEQAALDAIADAHKATAAAKLAVLGLTHAEIEALTGIKVG